jgi:ATP adenylyltransferase
MEGERKTNILWAPWRMSYIKETVENEERNKNKEGRNKCILCKIAEDNNDERNLILYRGTRVYIVLNKFPYNTGHIMVVPYRHVPSIEELDKCELLELSVVIKQAVKAIREAYRPDGFNIGANIGRAAGAGIDEHVHIHIVPRWVGDANFMPVIGGTKVIPQSLEDTYRQLKPAIEKYTGNIDELMRGC